MSPERVCALFDKNGVMIDKIKPQTNLDDLYSKAADWACREPIPRGYATHAVMDKLINDGYSIRWAELVLVWGDSEPITRSSDITMADSQVTTRITIGGAGWPITPENNATCANKDVVCDSGRTCGCDQGCRAQMFFD